MTVDDELRALAVQAADRYPDSLLHAQGWTRTELVAAIQQRLRTKYLEARRGGALIRDPAGVIRRADACPTPLKRRYRTERAAERFQRRHPAPGDPLRPYECPTGAHWHLTSQPERTNP